MRGTQIQGTVIKPGTGQNSIIDKQAANYFNLKLTKNTSWYVSFDQSTSCTGICLKAADNSFLILLDVIHDKSMTKDEYYRDLRRVIVNFAKGATFRIVVNEKPIPSNDKVHARNTLLELLGRLSTWLNDIPEFDHAQRGALFPQTWKSLVMDKSKGKHRSNIKAEIASDLVDVFPELRYYYDFYHTDDYDSFDALGILQGYLAYAFDEEGNPQIHGSLEKRHTSLVLYDWISYDSSLSFEDNIINALGANVDAFEPFALRYNKKHSFHDNIRMASSNFDCVVTILPREELAPYRWKFGIDITDMSKELMVIIIRKGAYSSGFINSAKAAYSWNEEVFSE